MASPRAGRRRWAQRCSSALVFPAHTRSSAGGTKQSRATTTWQLAWQRSPEAEEARLAQSAQEGAMDARPVGGRPAANDADGGAPRRSAVRGWAEIAVDVSTASSAVSPECHGKSDDEYR